MMDIFNSVFVFVFFLEYVGILFVCDIFGWILMGLFGIRWVYVVWVWKYFLVWCEG